jgi:hypothetical protein
VFPSVHAQSLTLPSRPWIASSHPGIGRSLYGSDSEGRGRDAASVSQPRFVHSVHRRFSFDDDARNHNPVQVDWNVQAYAEGATTFGPAGRDSAPQIAHRQKFSHRKLGRVSRPCHLVSQDGAIVCWYLPELVDADSQVHT